MSYGLGLLQLLLSIRPIRVDKVENPIYRALLYYYSTGVSTEMLTASVTSLISTL